MPYESFLGKIKAVKEPEIIAQWQTKMQNQTIYRLKLEPQPEQPFQSLEALRQYLLAHHRDRLVKAQDTVRLSGKQIEALPESTIRNQVLAYIERQRRFPLDTVNNIRGRLRKANLSLYKKGNKGISFVCAIKRKVRQPGMVFAESIQKLLQLLEAHPMITIEELQQLCGCATPPAAEGAEAAATAPNAEAKQLSMDIRWLVTEGFVIEYENGTLATMPVQAIPTPTDTPSAAEETPEAPTPEAGVPEPKEQAINE